jgi:hypothetical protein
MTTRWTVNINDTERGARIAVGAMAVLGGVFLLIAAGTALAVMLEVLLIAAGLDLVVTGATGHCPLYARLGHIPPSLQGRTS